MAERILPFPVPMTDIVKLEALQREHSKAVDAGDLSRYTTAMSISIARFRLCGNACLIETMNLAQKYPAFAHTRSNSEH